MIGMAEELGMPLLVGAHVPEAASGGTAPGPLRNAALLVVPDGSARMVHAKVRLVPGVERPGLSSGPGGGVLRIADLRMALAICFESAFGGDIRRLRREGAELLVNPTNDGWFRPRLGGAGTAAHAQHRAHLILRSVENRMGAVRSSLGGELLAIGPDGRVVTLRPVGAESLTPMRVSTSTTMTAYTRYGDLVGLACLLLLLLLLVPGSVGVGLRQR